MGKMSNESFNDSAKTTMSDENVDFYHHPATVHVALGFLILCSAYLLVATIYYQKRHAKRKCCSNALFIAASVILLIESAWFETEVLQTSSTSLFCTAYYAINATSATLIRTLVYGVLWLRQKELYRNTVTHLHNKCVAIMGKIILAGIVIFGVCQVAVLLVTPQIGTEHGCVTSKPAPVVKILTPVVFTTYSLFQFLLLGLTLYPVVQHMCGKAEQRNQRALEAVVVRLSVCTFVCVVCDISFMIATIKRNQSMPYNFIPIAFAFNSLINLFVSLCSFVDYEWRLCPFRPPRVTSTTVSSRSGSEHFRRTHTAVSNIDYTKATAKEDMNNSKQEIPL
ncbi:uncharacterized protein LOC144743353 [Ciona intestinalis]